MSTFGQLVLSGIFIGGIYALMSMGLTLIFGVLRIVNFAHGEFLMLGMYGAWAITRLLGLNPYIAAFMVSLEGLFSGIFVTFLLANFMAERHRVNRPRETEVIQ